jgi:tRNA (guanosine-2'-O-)-methyltransferase
MDLEPQAIIARLSPFLTPARIACMQAILAQRTTHLTALFDQIHDPLNIAACARTADTLGLQTLHAIPEPGHPFAPADLGRATSQGAERWLDLAVHTDAPTALSSLASYRLVAMTLTGDRRLTLDDLPLDRPLVLAFGNERRGLGASVLAHSEFQVSLPMRGFTQSLNVSVAFALALSHLRHRLEREVSPDRWSLTPAAREHILATWLRRDVDHADAILAARRSSIP